MILNGKCKEDFKKYIKTEMFHFGFDVAGNKNSLKELSDLFLNALIIDFFDSVNIKIFQYPFVNTEDFEGIIMHDSTYISTEDRYNTREKATKQAIIIANKIYNEKTNKARQRICQRKE